MPNERLTAWQKCHELALAVYDPSGEPSATRQTHRADIPELARIQRVEVQCGLGMARAHHPQLDGKVRVDPSQPEGTIDLGQGR